MHKIGFGGGCHWCTEGVFQALRGVLDVNQGFLQAPPPMNNWAEGVIVAFDPTIIPLHVLCEVHLRTHSPTRRRPVDSKYRSAIYIFESAQRPTAERVIQRVQGPIGNAVHTVVAPFMGFKASDARFRDYYRTDPSRPFCKTYIDPKLAILRREFADFSPSEAEHKSAKD